MSNGTWRTVRTKQGIALCSPSGCRYYGTAKEVREARLLPTDRRELAPDYALPMTRHELAALRSPLSSWCQFAAYHEAKKAAGAKSAEAGVV